MSRVGTRDVDGLMGLASREVHLLLRVLRNVCIKAPADPVRISMSNLSLALDVSEKTVQRAFRGLIDKGLIQRSQVKKRSGMEIVDTSLTAKALALLGFNETKKAQEALARRWTNESTSYNYSVSTVSKERHLDEPSAENIQIEEKKPKEAKVPSDLQCLLQLGLSAPAVFKLMKLATRTGQRLGVMINAVKDALKDAKNIYAYIRDLIKQQRDWSEKPKQPVRQKVSKETIEQQEAEAQRQRTLDAQKQRQDALKRVLAIFTEHKMLVNESGDKVWHVMSDCVFSFPIEDVHKKQLQRRNTADNHRHAELLRAFEDGRLMPYDPNKPVRGQSKAVVADTPSSSQSPKPPTRHQGFQKIDRLFPSLDGFEPLF